MTINRCTEYVKLLFVDTVDEVLLVNRSITEWETLFALNYDKERCYWVHRSFDKQKLKAFEANPNHNKLSDGEMDAKTSLN
jgi:hypothetical protein